MSGPEGGSLVKPEGSNGGCTLPASASAPIPRAVWFSTCPACSKPLGPWWLGDDKLCRGHEKPVAVDIDYPDQQRHFTPTNAQQRSRERRQAKRAKGVRL